MFDLDFVAFGVIFDCLVVCVSYLGGDKIVSEFFLVPLDAYCFRFYLLEALDGFLK